MTVPHPGEALKSELEKRGWAQADLIFVLGCQPKTVNQIINGKQGVSPAMSKALGDALGLSANHFADLQQAYDLSMASDPDPSVQIRANMRKNYPIREMIKRGWLQDGDAESLAAQFAKFFDAKDANEIPHLTHSAKKARYDDTEISPAQLAWLFRVRQIAKSIAVPQYSSRKLETAIARMRELLLAPEEARHVPRLLFEAGVRFVIVEALPDAKIDGVCFWLDDVSPVIGLSIRFDRIDNFWFVLRHECEHVLKGHGRGERVGMVDIELQSNTANANGLLPVEEQISNAAAADFCVPAAKMESFFLRKNPFFYEKDVLAFSKLNGVHPGLTVGQIQHRTAQYNYLKKYQTKIRQFVLPGAIVDGWGQTVPV